ncbi:MAG TPA: Sapep family Mn(2+)-dependent dipeptidase [Clostridia bacterium]|nr:Sapep family Mn(2+)-dependent dipeptidase [Clostridia bacterium]
MKYNFIDYRSDLIRDVSELIKIPTVFHGASATEVMPYGKNVYEGYIWLKEKAQNDGFKVTEFDGHALAIRIPQNRAPERIDVASHVDVVEPGKGWEHEPFGGAITGGYIHGRGAQDMKGPLIATYYALKYIKDNQIPCKRELRIVIGCDEERTMNDMRYYIAKANEPAFAFTPDGRFPYSYGEKGALMWTIDEEIDAPIIELNGGVQCNVVSPVATALIGGIEAVDAYRSMLFKYGYEGTVIIKDGKTLIGIMGKAAHASRPADGVNATVRLLRLVGEVTGDKISQLLYRCFSDFYGKGANIAYDIDPMGRLTLNLGTLKVADRHLKAEIDCRYPHGIASDILTMRMNKALKPLKAELAYDDKPTLTDRESPFLKVLLSTYREIAHDPTAAPSIGLGVTYSKVFSNCVAFGPLRENDQSLAHQANERIEIKLLCKLMRIYAHAMIRLANMD